MAKNLIVLFVIICIAAGLYLYTQPEQDTGLKKVTVMMPFIPQPQWMAYYTAKSKGYYEEEGLEVEIQYSTRGSAGPVEQLVGGNVDFILIASDSLVIGQTQGIDLVSFYLIEPTNLFYILSEKDKNITELIDLVGKEVGMISAASAAYPNLQAILHMSNLSMDDVEIVFAGTGVVTSFLEGQFDAIAAHLSQKVLIEEELEVNVIKASDYTNISSGHLIAMRTYIENDPETVGKFLRATKKGLEYAANNPDEAIDIYITFNPDAESKRDLSLSTWNEFIREFNYEQGLPGEESEAHWTEVQDTLYEIGLIDSKMDVSLFYTNEFLP